MVSGVDYSTVEGLQRKRLLKFVNHFVIQTANFLSNFSQTCDIKLANLAQKLAKIETSLTLLEHKLDSVPQLKSIGHLHVVQEAIIEHSESIEDTTCVQTEVADPALESFKKMIIVGVPKQAVKLKMQSMHLDEKLIEDFISQC